MPVSTEARKKIDAVTAVFGDVAVTITKTGFVGDLPKLWAADADTPNICKYGVKPTEAQTEDELYCALFDRVVGLVKDKQYVVYGRDRLAIQQVSGIQDDENTCSFQTKDRSYQEGQLNEQIVKFVSLFHRDPI